MALESETALAADRTGVLVVRAIGLTDGFLLLLVEAPTVLLGGVLGPGSVGTVGGIRICRSCPMALRPSERT